MYSWTTPPTWISRPTWANRCWRLCGLRRRWRSSGLSSRLPRAVVLVAVDAKRGNSSRRRRSRVRVRGGRRMAMLRGGFDGGSVLDLIYKEKWRHVCLDSFGKIERFSVFHVYLLFLAGSCLYWWQSRERAMVFISIIRHGHFNALPRDYTRINIESPCRSVDTRREPEVIPTCWSSPCYNPFQG